MADVLLLGADGYTGWPLACRLLDEGYDVHGVDNLSRRGLAGESVTPIASHSERADVATELFQGSYDFELADITQQGTLRRILDWVEPESVVNLAQIPSAPYSMLDQSAAWQTHENNVRGSLNLYWALHELGHDAHVVQLATMGEYGTPDAQIPEGFLADGRPAPKLPGSLYHASKVATTVNTLFLARTWGIPTTEVYQGIVYGVTTPATGRDDRLLTRFDADPEFGTVVNRFTAQALADRPVTVYGRGGQKRAMLSLRDCVECLTLAVENPPSGGTPYLAVNQFDGAYRVRQLAEIFHREFDADVTHVDNPRLEDDSAHWYDVEQEVLDDWGYEPAQSLDAEIRDTMSVLDDYRDRLPDDLTPEVTWN